MTRKSRNLIVSLAVLILASVALLLVRPMGKKTEASASPLPVSITLTEIPTVDLRSVLAETVDGKRLHFYSSDGSKWMVADTPEYYRSDPNRISTAVRAYSRIRSNDIVAEGDGQSRSAEFGLNPPQAIVTMKDRNGSTTILEIGSASPSGAGRFGRIADSDSIVIIPTGTAERSFGDIDDFRDISLPTVSLEKLSGFAFRKDGLAFIAEPRTEENPFVSHVSSFDVISPFRGRYPLDDYILNKALAEETPLPRAVRAYLDEEDPENPDLGLDRDTADRLYISDSDGGLLSLLIGSSDSEGNRYVTYGDRQDAVFLLSDKDIAVIETKPFMLIGKFVFLGSITDVSKVKVEYEGETWIMERTELGDPEDSKDDKFAINGTEIAHKEFTSVYQKFISAMWEGEAEKNISLGSPEIRITVSHDNPGVEKAVIRYWPYDDVYYQATVNEQPLEFLVGRYQVTDFIEDLAALAEFTS